MKALVLKDLRQIALADCAEPKVEQSRDAVVRVTTTAICGSDMHIYHGRDQGFRMGTIMGHEFAGIIEEVGDGVGNFVKGDRVISPFSINCGECFFCLRDLPARCVKSFCFGFVDEQGTGLQGAQAEFVRVPLANSTLLKIPQALKDEEVLFIGDIFSTAYSCAEAAQIRRGDTVVVIGCGPVGLLCILAARLFEPNIIVAVDSIDYRLEKAGSFGAMTANPDAETLTGMVRDLTDGRGADAVLEAVGSPGALDLGIQTARAGAVVSIAGYHTESVYELPIQLAYTKNLTIRIGRCNARRYMPLLLPLVEQKKIPMTEIVTHVLALSDGVRGYEIFDQRLDRAVKVILKP